MSVRIDFTVHKLLKVISQFTISIFGGLYSVESILAILHSVIFILIGITKLNIINSHKPVRIDLR